MSLEEANHTIRISIIYSTSGWRWKIDTLTPFGFILGYKKYDNPNKASEELKQFLRYFTKNVLKNRDTINAYYDKHNPNKTKT